MEGRAPERYSGSSFDDFLEEEGYRDEAERAAVERVLAWQFEQQTAQGEGYL